MPRRGPERSIEAEDNLAARIVFEREKRGWSPAGLAHRLTQVGCPLTQTAIWKIENGQPRRRITFDEAVAFAKVFGLALEDLMRPPQDVASAEAVRVIGQLTELVQQMEDIAKEADQAWRELAKALATDGVREALFKSLGSVERTEAWLDVLELRQSAAKSVVWLEEWRDFHVNGDGFQAMWAEMLDQRRNSSDILAEGDRDRGSGQHD